MFARILVPLDGSTRSEHALPYAVQLAQQFSADLVLLGVVPPLVYGPVMHNAAGLLMEPGGDMGILVTVQEQQRQGLQAYLDEVAQRSQVAALQPRLLIEEGTVADAILAVAESSGADTIVMATHGRGGISRWLLGSNADRVVQHSTIPVLLIRPTADE